MKITKQLIKRFENPEIEVKTINGIYKRATATVKYSGGKEHFVEVYRTHPSLEHFGGEDREQFIYATSSYSGVVYEVPSELQHVADTLYGMAETSDEEAQMMLKSITRSLEEFNQQMGF